MRVRACTSCGGAHLILLRGPILPLEFTPTNPGHHRHRRVRKTIRDRKLRLSQAKDTTRQHDRLGRHDLLHLRRPTS